MPLTKREVITKQTKRVEASTAYVLNSFIAWNPTDDGRISVGQAAQALDNIDIETRTGEIRRWLSGTVCPKAPRLWDLGNALRRAGSPWITGWWLLWACERYIEFFRILQRLCTRAPALTPKKFGLIRQMFSALRPLAERTVFDRDLANRDGYTSWPQLVRSKFLDRNILGDIRNWAQDSWGVGWDDVTQGAPHAIAKDLGVVIRREIAKIPWHAYGHIGREIEDASGVFLAGDMEQPHVECDILIDSAIRLVSVGIEVGDGTLAICENLVTEYIDRVCRIRTGCSAITDDRFCELLSDDYSRFVTMVWLDDPICDDQYEELLDSIDEVVARIESIDDGGEDTALF